MYQVMSYLSRAFELISWIFTGAIAKHFFLWMIAFGYSTIFHKYILKKRNESVAAAGVNFAIAFVVGWILYIINRWLKFLDFSGTLSWFDSLYEDLIMGEHINIWNILIIIGVSGYSYMIWAKKKEQCVWDSKRSPKRSRPRQWIKILTAIYCSYPLALAWRTYSLEDKSLINTRVPLSIYSIFLWLMFLPLFVFIRPLQNERNKDEDCGGPDTDGKSTNRMKVWNFYLSGSWNYLLIFWWGFCIKYFMMWYYEIIKNKGIAGFKSGFWNTLENLLIVCGSFFSAIYGGIPLWTEFA